MNMLIKKLIHKALCVFTLLVIIWIVLGLVRIYTTDDDGTDEPQRIESPTEGHTFAKLLDAIEWVESKGDPWAIGDGGDAVGAYQIHKIFVDDVNRLAKSRIGYFSYTDRSDRNKSRKMATIYLKHYGGTFEEMARKHNGGPQGHKKESTKAYWLKVKARMEQ